MRYLPLLLLCGCVTKIVDIDYGVKPPADWPALEERITYADAETIKRWCNVPKAIRHRVENCAVLSFKYGLCMIYLSSNDPEVLRHERAHCAGYNHVGDGGKAHQAWEAFKKKPSDAVLAQ